MDLDPEIFLPSDSWRLTKKRHSIFVHPTQCLWTCDSLGPDLLGGTSVFDLAEDLALGRVDWDEVAAIEVVRAPTSWSLLGKYVVLDNKRFTAIVLASQYSKDLADRFIQVSLVGVRKDYLEEISTSTTEGSSVWMRDRESQKWGQIAHSWYNTEIRLKLPKYLP